MQTEARMLCLYAKALRRVKLQVCSSVMIVERDSSILDKREAHRDYNRDDFRREKGVQQSW
jgi:hypothetical protein